MEKIIQPLSAVPGTPAEPVPASPIIVSPSPKITASQPIQPSAPLPPAQVQSVYAPLGSIDQTHTAADLPIGLTGSALAAVKPKLPVGIYIIAGLNLIGFVGSLFSSTSNSGVASTTMLADLLLGVGLLLRIDLIRKVAVFFAVLSAVIYAVSFFGLLSVQSRVNQAETKFNQAVAVLNTQKGTLSQKQAITELESQVTVEKAKEGHAIAVAFTVVGAECAVSIIEAVYLTRPAVKDVFVVAT